MLSALGEARHHMPAASDREGLDSKTQNLEALEAMYSLAEMGVTPDEYARFYLIYDATKGLLDDDNVEDEDILLMPRRPRFPAKEYRPLENAENFTLVLKIQMKDVTKPPMWREITIPAHYNFMQLHEAIQVVTGLHDCHLWQFNVKAYDGGLCIALSNDDGFGVIGATHNPSDTPLTQFLQQKKDKLEYVYDFGDDWIFTVEVKDVLHETTEHPQFRKYKSELNALDDMGGVWAYLTIRDAITNWNGLGAKGRKECAENFGFRSPHEFEQFISEQMIDLEYVCTTLIDI